MKAFLNGTVITDSGVLSYAELDRRANQVARHLIATGIKPGDRIGLLFDKSAETYGPLTITSFYVGYLLPLMVEVQHFQLNEQ